MSRMRVKGDWEDVVEFYSMGLGMVKGRRGEGMWKGCGRVMFWFMGLWGGDGGRGLMRILGKLNQDLWDERMDQELFRWSGVETWHRIIC